jgi:chemotaxis protein MotA
MDPATLGGIVLALGSLIVMAVMEGASPLSLLIPAPMILVFGGAIGAAIASTTLPDAIASFKALPKAMLYKNVKMGKDVELLVELAETARKDGLLALEAKAADVKDPYLKKSLQNIADGMDADDLRLLMEDEAAAKEKTGRSAAKFYAALGGYAPTVGILGTVVSLTHVLENLSNPDTLGESIASAFVATLWGVLSANLIWLPIGSRIGKMTDLQSERFVLLTEGVLAVQSGAQPRTLAEKLYAMLPESEQPKSAEKGAPAKSKAKAPKTAEAAA